jgi:predicted O-methyltransferase YrrM
VKNSSFISKVKSKMSIGIRRLIRQVIDYPDMVRRAERHSNAFATHVPVLTALGQTIPIHRVLEFGSGTISTLLFLNPVVFPYVESVVSYENDKDWCRLVRSQTADPRLDLQFVPNYMHTVVTSIDLGDFDLIFVDDSKSLEQRSQTIIQLALRKDEINGLVVVHDFEHLSYRRAASPFVYRKRFRAFNPEVGLLWTRNDLDLRVFKQIDQLIKTNAPHIPPDNVDEWTKAVETLTS